MKLTVFLPLVLISVGWLVRARRCPKKLLCGTNGITYKNNCEFTKALADDPDIEIQFEGSCMEYRKRRLLLQQQKLKFDNPQPVGIETLSIALDLYNNKLINMNMN